METPVIVTSNSFQRAWLQAVNLLSNNRWSLWNLVVYITDPTNLDYEFHNHVNLFAVNNGLIKPKGVAYTIFPHKLYRRVNTLQKVYDGYNDRIYPWTRTRSRKGWGTYFHRMINYDGHKNVNQLDNIISAINNRPNVSKAAYTIIIEKPGGETIRPIGAPCLNYIAIQMERTNNSRKISLLATYRHHDFLERAYGNYWGLCNLLNCIVQETKSEHGSITCVSSRAYVDRKKTPLRHLLEELIEV